MVILVWPRTCIRKDTSDMQGEAEGVKLPYKWLAMESLSDAIFNEKTDVVCCY